MGLFHRNKKGLGDFSASFTNVGGVNAIGRSYSQQTKEGYDINPYVYRCVHARAAPCASIDFVLYDKNDEIMNDRNHKLYKLLDRPNPRMSGRDFKYELQAQLGINGNAFVYPIKTVLGVSELWSISPDRVNYLPSNNIFDPVQYWQVNVGNGVITIMPEDMIHLKTFSTEYDGVLGVSPMQAAGFSIAQQNAAREWNTSVLKNGAKNGMQIDIPGEMTSEGLDRFKEKFRSEYVGPQNSGKTMFFTNGTKAEAMGFTAVEMDYANGITVSAKEIAIAYQVPPEKVGDSANKTYSNMQEANKEFASNTLVSLMDQMCDVLTLGLVRYYPDVGRIGYDPEQISDLLGDKATMLTAYNGCSFLTLNEKREALGYRPVDASGDVIMVPMGNIPLNEAVQPAIPIEPPEDDTGV